MKMTEAGKSSTGLRADGYQSMVIERSNASFESYYRLQNIMADSEFGDFLAALQRPLPTTFRITGHGANTALVMEQLIQDHVNKIDAPNSELGESSVPRPIAWYPRNLAWQLDIDRAIMRKEPKLASFYRWLVSASENGDVTRQESVSMIPPLLLDIEPHHLVLDVCAAPGSKTSQLLERLHERCTPGQVPTGAVLANDVNKDRAYMLFHQLKRFDSPALLVTNHDGTFFPNLYLGPDAKEPLEFDRILADVPCSGDGTLRKNIDIWMNWTPKSGLGLHPTQVRILERSLLMLKVGGRLVYSTCTFNPIENEAVVAHILTKHTGKVRIVDASEHLAGLKYRNGLCSWTVVADKSGRRVCLEDLEGDLSLKMPASAFSRPEYANLGLDKCVRVLPQDQDSGGFFIVLLEKVAELGGERSRGRMRLEDARTEAVDDETKPKKRSRVQDEEPFAYLDHDSEIVENLRDFMGISREDIAKGCFLVRSTKEQPKNLYYVSNPVGSLVKGPNGHLRIVNTGIKCFDLYDNKRLDYPCPYRLTMDGIACFLPMLQKRVYACSAADLLTLLATEDSVTLDQLSADLTQQLSGTATGSAVLRLESGSITVALPVWVAGNSCKVFVARPDRPKLIAHLSKL